MKREKIDGINERDFIVSLIMSSKCCKSLIPYIKLDYFESDYARIVIGWVIEYFKKFRVCPKDDITSLYISHCDEIQDESLKDLVATFLQNLSESNLNINNEDYLLDRSKDYLDSLAMKNYTEKLDACIAVGDVEKARKIQSQFKRVSETETNEISLFDKSATKDIQTSLMEAEEELMTLPENLNKVTGKLHRNDFLAILAPPKTGKSFFMQQIAYEAVKQSLNVVFVSLEMTRAEVVRRFWKMMYGSKSGVIDEGVYEGARIIPDPNEEGKYTSELIDIRVKESSKRSVAHLQNQMNATINHKGDIRIISYPSMGASVQDITDRVEELAKEGFIADVVIIDYCDITKPMGGGTELRNQLDAIWKHLRFFAMKFHCLVVTASQTNRAGIGTSEVDATKIAEDIRKLAIITSFVSMEQTRAMKKQHLMRIRNIAVREGYVEETCVFPQCLGLGQFISGSPVLGKDFNFPNDDEE